MSISDKLNKVIEGSLDVDQFLDELKSEFKSPINEVLFGDIELNDLFNEYLSNQTDENREKLKSHLNANLDASKIETYSANYWIESGSPGNSFADINLQDKLQRCFGTKMKDTISALDLCDIKYCIGWKNGRVDSAIWIIGGTDFPVRVYSRLNGEICICQSIEPTVDDEMVHKLCESYLNRYKSSATSDGLKAVLRNLGINKMDSTELPYRFIESKVDVDSIKSAFGIESVENLSSKVYELLGSSACVLWNNLLDKLIVIQDNKGFQCDTNPMEFESLLMNVLCAINENDFDAVANLMGNGKIHTFQVRPYEVEGQSKFDTSPDGTELTYKFNEGDRSIGFKLIDLKDGNYSLEISVDDKSTVLKFNTRLKLTELAECIENVITSNSSLAIEPLKYKIAINLLSNCRLEG